MKYWKIIYHTMTGKSHLEEGRSCEDAIQVSISSNRTILVLADGAGSASKAQIGALFIVNEVAKWLSKNTNFVIDNPIFVVRERLSSFIIKKLNQLSKEKGGTISDYSSTLLFILATKNNFVSGHIGDGVIGYTLEEDHQVLSEPERGEFANSTFFTTSPDLDCHLRMHRGPLKGIDSFFLMSDGSAENLFNSQDYSFAPALNKLYIALKSADANDTEPVQLMLSEAMEKYFRSRTGDDCSFIMLQWRHTHI